MQTRTLLKISPVVLTAAAAVTFGARPAPAQTPAQPAAATEGRAWSSRFTQIAKIPSAGKYKADVEWNFESFSPLCLEPSFTAVYTVGKLPNKNHIVFNDTNSGLKPNPAPPPFFTRGEGAISAFGWVDSKYSDVRVTGEINTAAEAGNVAKPAKSRQGLLARWDQGNNYYWFNVNFATGSFGITRSRFFGVMDNLKGSVGDVKDFSNSKSYYLEFEMLGPVAHGRVYELDAAGNKKLVGDTGDVVDPEPHQQGVAGVLAELAFEAPYEPLQASFANVSASPIRALAAAAQQGGAR